MSEVSQRRWDWDQHPFSAARVLRIGVVSGLFLLVAGGVDMPDRAPSTSPNAVVCVENSTLPTTQQALPQASEMPVIAIEGLPSC